MKTLIASLIALSLAACGGGGGAPDLSAPADPTPVATPTPTPTPAPVPFVAPVVQAATKATHLLIFGDSTMAFGGYSDQPDSVYLSELAALPVDNFAISGTTIFEMLYGTVAYTQPMPTTLSASSADLVIENYGINDTLAQKGETLAQYTYNLGRFVDDVRAAGKVPVLEEPNPTCGTGGMYDALVLEVDAINRVAAEKGVMVVHQFYAIQQIPGWCSMYEQYGVHPLTALTKIKAQNEYDQLKAAGYL